MIQEKQHREHDAYRRYRNENRKNSNPYYIDENEGQEDYGYGDYDYNDPPFTSKDEKESAFLGMQRLFAIQIIACLIITLLIFVFKLVGGTYYESFKLWYDTELNKSILVGNSAQEYQSATLLTSQKLKERINTNSDSIAVNAQVKLSDSNTTHNSNNGELSMTTKLTKPVESAKITSTFSDPQEHRALDLAAHEGSDIVAALSGKVEKVGENDSYGKYVILDSGNSIKTLYAHCKDIVATEGQDVIRGSKVATVGSTGNSTGPHLHFELLIKDTAYDPLPLIQGDYV